MLIDLDQQATQAAFGELVGIAQPSVSALMAEGKLPGAGTLRELLLLLPAPARAGCGPHGREHHP
jgi:predicted XRE-type DNA-binding protein